MDFYVKLCIEKVIESIYSKGTFCTKSNHGIYDEYFVPLTRDISCLSSFPETHSHIYGGYLPFEEKQ